jgi:dCMP deaminase
MSKAKTISIMNSILVDFKDNDDRIDWDTYFMFCAVSATLRSPCKRLHVGCVIVRDNRVLCTGYNGFLAGLPHNSIVRDNHEQATIHAEQNAVGYAAKNGVKLDGATAYITHYPCINCAKILAASGIKKIVYKEDYSNDPLVAQIITNIEIIKYNSSS